jgi:hypothetical protein
MAYDRTDIGQSVTTVFPKQWNHYLPRPLTFQITSLLIRWAAACNRPLISVRRHSQLDPGETRSRVALKSALAQ